MPLFYSSISIETASMVYGVPTATENSMFHMAAERWVAPPPVELFEFCSTALRRARLRHQDFRKTIAEANKNSFIYADPPYFTSTERTFIEYGKKSFGQTDLQDLIEGLVDAAKRGIHVALTYNEAMQLTQIPKNWCRIRFEITRNVGGFSGTRKKQTEILYTSQPVVRGSA